MRRSLVHRAAAVCCLVLAALPAAGQPSRVEDPFRFFKWIASDVGAVRGVGWETLAGAAGTGAVVFALMPQDSAVTGRATRFVEGANRDLLWAVEEVGNVHAVRPLALTVFVGTLFGDDPRLQDAAFTSLEAVVFADLTTRALKSVFGRARPWQGQGSLRFAPLSGNTSFPSGHATVAFALVTPWVAYYPGAWTAGLVVLAAGTAFTRVALSYHWLTDTVAGAAVGAGVGAALSARHLRYREGRTTVLPVGRGGPGVTLRVGL